MRSWYRGCCSRECSLHCVDVVFVCVRVKSGERVESQGWAIHACILTTQPKPDAQSTLYIHTHKHAQRHITYNIAPTCARGDGNDSSLPARYLSAQPPQPIHAGPLPPQSPEGSRGRKKDDGTDGRARVNLLTNSVRSPRPLLPTGGRLESGRSRPRPPTHLMARVCSA